MKSLLVVNDLGIGIGGTQKRVYQLVKKLLEEKIFDHIFVIAHKSAEGKEKQKEANITVLYSDKKNVGKMMYSLFQENDIDIVQVHNLSLLSTEPIGIAKKMGKKVIFFAHDYWPVCGRRSFYARWKKPCTGVGFVKCNFCIGPLSYIHLTANIQQQVNACDLGIATSEYMVDVYEKNGVLKGKWKQIVPWIEEEYFKENKKGGEEKKKQEIEKKEKIMLYVGSLDKEKGFFDALEVFLELQREHKELRLFAVGGVSEENKRVIEKKIQEENAVEKVNMVGYKADVQELISYYKHADLFVFPSLLEESFGQTWAQALACGIPVIAYGTGSVQELLGNYGTITQVGNKKKLKRAIEEFFFNKKKQEKVKEEEAVIKKYAKEEFSMHHAIPLLKEIYRM